MKKIVFISESFPPAVEGTGDYTGHLAREFMLQGHEVYVICTNKESITRNGDNALPIRVLPIIDQWDWKAIGTITDALAQIKPDWVNLQYVPYLYNHYGVPVWMNWLMVSLKMKGYKVAITFHELWTDLEWKKPKYVPVALIQRFIVFVIAFLADRLIVGNEIYQKRIKAFQAKMALIPIGSNILPKEIPVTTLQERKKQLAPNGEFILTSFGIRDHLTLVHAMSQLTEQKNPVKLLLLGKLYPKNEQKLKLVIDQYNLRDKVYMPGYLENDELFLNLRCSDTFVLLEENRGGVTSKSASLGAAYAASLPIVGTKGHMTDSWFKHGENILFTDGSNIVSIVKTLKDVIDNKDNIRDVLSNGARQTYSHTAYYSWETIYKKYMEHLSA